MSKFDIKKAKSLKFVRYGGLSSVNQKGYKSKTDDFHGPPARRGFYCFVWPHCEMFLLGGYWTKDPWNKGSKFSYLRDKDGNLITDKHLDYEKFSNIGNYWSCSTSEWARHSNKKPEFPTNDSDYDAYYKICDEMDKEWTRTHPDTPRFVLTVKPHPKTFTYDGDLWHHLGSNLKPSQILKSKESWVKTTMENYRWALEKEMHASRTSMVKNFEECGDEFAHLFHGKNPFRFSSKDHLEVFIEKL